ncbi:unnamed protein product [Aspergillus oryzae]|nr:unnamed protein product [Aspergillus oryzae]
MAISSDTNSERSIQLENEVEPILFICHGTGGLVAKAALAIAAHSTSNLASILTSCYGIAFMATPHQGSSYLSAPEYAKSIRRLMQLKYHVPHSIREVLKPRHPRLLQLSNQFRSISADIKIWTFLETVDSTLTVADSGTVSTVEMHVPITSIRSGVLDLEHEKVIPLATDHVGVASFKGQELTTRISFIKELQPIVAMAVQLSKLPDAPLRVSREVMVQVNGFFEDTARGVSDETPLKLWSTKTPLREYLKEGPAICLTDRLKQTGRISSGSIDDSSISDFDSRPSSAAMADTSFAMRDGVVAEASAIQSETVSSRPSIRRTRSFVAAASPRIHVTEAAADSYFNVPQEEATSDIQSDTVSSEDPGHRDSVADDRKETTAGSSSPTSLSSKYRNFLPLPPPTRERLQEVRAELPRRAPRFDRPEPGSEKLLWIHVPYTHTGWVPPVLSKACNDQQRPELKVIEKRLQQGRSKPVPEYISESHVETRLIWKFLGAEPPIHIRRTLDQYGYPNLRSTIARDDDQMLWKRTRKVVDLSHELGSSIPLQDNPDSSKTFVDGKVLMVDQLWLWIVDEKTVVTFFPKQEATTAEDKLYEQANLHNSIYNELNGDLARRFETAGDLAALIVLHAVTILLDRTLDHDLQILRIFEESISILRFRTRGFIARPADYNRTLEGKTMTASERDERDRRVANQNREDLSTLLELRDIIDELGTILKLLEQQTATVKIMAQYFEDKGYGKVFIESALSRLEDYRTQVTDMRENAHLAQKAVRSPVLMPPNLPNAIERLRDSVVKAHIIGVGIITDFFLLPVKGVFKLGAVASPAKPAPGQSESTGRLDRYLGNRRYNKQFEDDIWKRHEDRVISPLPAVHVSDMEGMMGFDLSEKGGRWQQSVNGAREAEYPHSFFADDDAAEGFDAQAILDCCYAAATRSKIDRVADVLSACDPRATARSPAAGYISFTQRLANLARQLREVQPYMTVDDLLQKIQDKTPAAPNAQLSYLGQSAQPIALPCKKRSSQPPNPRIIAPTGAPSFSNVLVKLLVAAACVLRGDIGEADNNHSNITLRYQCFN